MWQFFGFAALIAVVLVLAWWLDPKLRQGRKFKAELAARKPLSDTQMTSQCFAAEDIAAEVPARVRRVFAKHMAYPAEKLRPDDDLTFFWFELDMAPLIEELELVFGVKLAPEEIERTPWTIRAVSLLVANTTCPTKD